MAVTIDTYPVNVVGGIVQNVFPGFKPIELVFSNTGSTLDQTTVNVVGIEMVITSPFDETVDYLGFSLYSDFGPDIFQGLGGAVFHKYATVDVSIINDILSQSPILSSAEIDVSRVKYRLKYRPVFNDGTVSGYTWLNGEYPIICEYATDDLNLDEFLTVQESPVLWKGYPVMVGFIHSDQNYEGPSVEVRYDVYDITGSTVSSDNVLNNYGTDVYGLILANIGLANISGVSGGGLPADYVDFRIYIGQTVNTKKYLIEEPDSYNDSAFEEYEFMLSWYNGQGSPVQWLFHDWENTSRIRTNPVNISDQDKIQSIPESERNIITLVAEDIDRSDLQMFRSLFKAKTVYRVFTSSSGKGYDRLAMVDNSIEWVQSKQRYRIEVSLLEKSGKLWT